MNSIRVAVIGAGSLACSVHYPSLVDIDAVELVGACDLDSARLGAAVDRFGIPRAYTDYGEMLDELRPDAVYAIMPPHILFDVAMDVLERGHHLFIEKPPGITALQTESMARLATRQGLVTAVGFQRRYHPLVRACWAEVKKSGTVHQVVACFYKNQPPKDTHPYYRGAIDILRSDAIHIVDSLRYYCGLSDARTVCSEVRTLDSWYATSFNTLVEFANGSVGVLLANWRAGRRVLKFEFHAYGASAYVDADGIGQVWTDNRGEPDFSSTHTECAGSSAPYIAQGFLAENRAFIECVRSGKSAHNSLEDAVWTMQLADRIYESAINKGRW